MDRRAEAYVVVYVGARRLSATKQVAFFIGLLKEVLWRLSIAQIISAVCFDLPSFCKRAARTLPESNCAPSKISTFFK
jgi:hypothetical protein